VSGTDEGRGPLAGIRVLEACHVLAGPYCGMLLADLGADVIKIESPQGDLARTVGPHSIGPHNAYFASLNRNKRSVCLDLATEEGQEGLHRLATGAHAVITNMRPAAIKKLGLTYDALRKWNERIVCVALTGYGLDGPYADRPAYDYVIQALVGVMAITGDPGGPPTKAGYSAVDNSAGIMGAVGVLAKIIEGKGGQVDVSLYDAMLSQMNYLAGAYLNAGAKPERQKAGSHPYIVPAQVFPTKDGYLSLFVSHDEFWRRFATEVDRPEWLEDPRFATMEARAANRETVLAAVETIVAEDTAVHWVERLSRHGIVVACVETLDQALDGELAEYRDMVATIPTPHGLIRVVGNPVKIIGHETRYSAPPLLGEHTGELLSGEPRGK
jgi:crotonobetainyl-CoA:carnitine CoA-transferase CaiB-like acyl-CoA transferase